MDGPLHFSSLSISTLKMNDRTITFDGIDGTTLIDLNDIEGYHQAIQFLSPDQAGPTEKVKLFLGLDNHDDNDNGAIVDGAIIDLVKMLFVTKKVIVKIQFLACDYRQVLKQMRFMDMCYIIGALPNLEILLLGATFDNNFNGDVS